MPTARRITPLVLLLLAAACSPQYESRSVDVDFLWVKGGSGTEASGGSTHATLTVEHSSSGMQVGIFETKSGGTGEMWRAAVWVAALTGTLQLQKNPLDFQYSVKTVTLGNRVDGPSAGGLFTVAIMAALNGDTIDGKATMTGTINPDGSIGPVGGVSQKLEAVKTLEKKRLCYPVGQQFDEDMNTGKPTDIKAKASTLGIEAIEVEDISQAYQCLTGKALKPTKPVRRSDMELSKEAFEILRKATENWLQQCEVVYAASRKLNSGEQMEKLWNDVSAVYDSANALLKQGLVAAAYWKAVEALSSSLRLLSSSLVVNRLSGGKALEALQVFNEMEAEAGKKLKTAFQALSDAPPEFVNATIASLDAYEAAIAAYVAHQFAKATFADILGRLQTAIARNAKVDEISALFAELNGPLGELVMVQIDAQLAIDNAELMKIQRSGRGTKLARLDDVATLYQGAASANIAYFDAIFVKELATQAGKSVELVSRAMMESEPNYRSALLHLKLPENSAIEFAATGLPSQLAKLAGALSSYFASSTLVAKFYSIGAKMDTNGRLVGVEREKALIATLQLAEEKARENAAMAVSVVGVVPESAKVCYQIGLVLRERPTYEEKLQALEQFWRSSAWSQVAVYLARLEKEHSK